MVKEKRMTPKEVKSMPGRHIAIRYCAAHGLLSVANRVGYVVGSMGWNYDVYNIDGIVITTGYRNCIGEHLNYDTLTTWENKAQEMIHNWAPIEDRKALLHEWILAL